MHTDYLPQSPHGLLDWLITQETEMTAALAEAIGTTESDRADFLAAVGEFKATVKPLVELMDLIKQLRAVLPEVKKAQLPAIRGFIVRAKLSTGCTPEIIKRLDWDPIKHNIDLNEARPRLKAEVQRGQVKIIVKRPGFEQINLYSRRKGTTEWSLLIQNATRFPKFDKSPLAVEGQPEVREYMAIGVVNGEEVGRPSEVVEVVFAG